MVEPGQRFVATVENRGENTDKIGGETEKNGATCFSQRVQLMAIGGWGTPDSSY